jgi:hypothetical protein
MPPDVQPFLPASPNRERRLHPRYTVNVPIEIHEEGSRIPLRVKTTDLSRGGCYIKLTVPLGVGGRIRAQLSLDGQPIVARGRVVTRHPDFGNGIMFLEFEGEGEKLLRQYLAAVVATP